MPRDSFSSSTPAYAASNDLDSRAPPLKRGDACLYCRKRRIRCSATKPSCHHCTKLKRECVYDSGKPVSRVRTLENKVAELESALAAVNANPSLAGATPHGGALNQSSPFDDDIAPGTVHGMSSGSTSAYRYGQGSIEQSTVDINMMDDFQPAPGRMNTYPVPMVGGVGPHSSGDPTPPYDWDRLQPGYMSVVGGMSQISTGQQSPHPSMQPPMGGMNNMQYAGGGPPQALPGHIDPLADPLNMPSATMGQQSASSHVYRAYVAEDETESPQGLGNPAVDALSGGWYDPNDIPPQARDQLLHKFFTGMRMLGRGYHVPRFMSSLSLPPSRRPHPCLLYAMYLMVARFSTSQKLRQLESHFLGIVQSQLQESVARQDRLFDAMRATCILAIYKYSVADYGMGSVLTGQAGRLALQCGLHQIRSGVYKPSALPADRNKSRLLGMMRQRAFFLGPPKDAVELGERIWAFWNIYIVDRAGAISSQWPVVIPDNEISTPFPRPLDEYELGLLSTKDDYNLASMYDDKRPPQVLPHIADSSSNILYIRALALLERASKLMYLPPESEALAPDTTPVSASDSTSSLSGTSPDIDNYLRQQNYIAAHNGSQNGNGSANGGSRELLPRTASVRVPKQYEEIRLALLRIENDLPPCRRTPWGVWDGKAQDWHFQVPRKDVVTLHFILGCAWMFLFDVYEYQSENHDAVAVARRLAFTIRCMIPGTLKTDLDVFVSMCWSFISMILIRETKRLQALGETAIAAVVEQDVETVVDALKTFGKQHNLATVQAERVNKYRDASLSDMRFMKGKDKEFDNESRSGPEERV